MEDSRCGRCLSDAELVGSSACRRGNCKKASLGLLCEVGLRCRTYYVLCGSVLSVWNELEEVLSPVSGTNVKVQIVRLRTEDGQRIVGKFIRKVLAVGSTMFLFV